MKKLQKKIRSFEGTIEAFVCDCICGTTCTHCDCGWNMKSWGETGSYQRITNLNGSYVWGTA